MIINHTQENILLLLAKYKYLTSHQLQRLGVSPRLSTINTHLRALRERPRPLVKAYEPFHPHRVGRLGRMHFLTPASMRLLKDKRPEFWAWIKVPTAPQFAMDFLHRRSIIDVQIALEQLFGYTDQFGQATSLYFDCNGNMRRDGNLAPSTRLTLSSGKHVDPDLICNYEMNGQRFLFCVEMANGSDTKRIVNQVLQYRQVLWEGSLSKKLGLKVGFRILFVFEKESTLKAVLWVGRKIPGKANWTQTFSALEGYFLFAHLPDLLKNAKDCRVNFSGERIFLM